MRYLIIFLFVVLLLSGCTFHFKGTDIEATGEVVKRHNRTYELEKIDIFKNANPEKQIATNHRPQSR